MSQTTVGSHNDSAQGHIGIPAGTPEVSSVVAGINDINGNTSSVEDDGIVYNKDNCVKSKQQYERNDETNANAALRTTGNQSIQDSKPSGKRCVDNAFNRRLDRVEKPIGSMVYSTKDKTRNGKPIDRNPEAQRTPRTEKFKTKEEATEAETDLENTDAQPNLQVFLENSKTSGARADSGSSGEHALLRNIKFCLLNS